MKFDKGEEWQGLLCIYQTHLTLRTAICVIRTDHIYLPWTLSPPVSVTALCYILQRKTTRSAISGWLRIGVFGCQTPGRYGQECDLICPSNCDEQRCHIVDGTCLGCTAGWIGHFCNKTCPDGYYGMKCRSGCLGHCRDGVSCNHTSGECNNGCENGWQGVNCNQECEDGRHGPNCVYACSGNCLNNMACDKTNGTCQSCTPGYTGNFCNNTCNTGFYGPNCSYKCSNCIDDACNRFKKECIYGCAEGYAGKGCDRSCKSGWFGFNCSQKCSDNCIDQLCDNIRGNCTRGCLTGWLGHNCTKECPLGLFGANCEQWCSPYCAFNDTCDRTNGSCPRGCQHPFKGSNCDFKDSISPDKDIQYAYIAAIVALITLNISTCGAFIFLSQVPHFTLGWSEEIRVKCFSQGHNVGPAAARTRTHDLLVESLTA
ncbi:multiple epidermal growth factor-like domains protein 11 isoform X2 [Ostrea edulis]|uniref:multiple epidermal growth factor-like domains protein 11 isoform X2 n=1 Tax=Ostrea edulis TaxID=37623 RepID=UPI0020947E90|nr:multiple epidermal growth factor-like domains protein 11 isoform X2 [Ostrea edulis]